MSNKKQNSIDWLVSILNKPGFAPVLTDEEIQQAKAMHEEEIINSYCKAGLDIAHNDSIKESGLAQEYYNETFGGDNE